MKKPTFLISTLLFYLSMAFLFTACPHYGYKYNTGILPDSPVNLAEINSSYDDYNLSAPFIRDVFPLVFSSNRHSQGGEMDFVYKLMALDFDKETGELSFYNETDNNLDVTSQHNTIPLFLNQINSADNEFGPYIKSYWYEIVNTLPGYSYDEHTDKEFAMLYASEKEGDLDMYYIHNHDDEIVNAPLSSVNSEYNEAYPSFRDDFSELFFCSDQEGQYDIYSVDWNNDILLEESLANKDLKVRKALEQLNSNSNDKCPYMDEHIMVFTSDRAGGFGGYDLYYSKWENDQWSDPVNLGDQINTSADEYRPILRLQNEFDKHLLMFSSNRPGGKGGFDLYYTGVDLD
jgi:hypothetical protein